jgi:hypothetical protein
VKRNSTDPKRTCTVESGRAFAATNGIAIKPLDVRVPRSFSDGSGGGKTKVKTAHVAALRTDRKIVVLNQRHGARPGSKRQIGMDIILKAKTVNTALPILVKAGCNSSFIKFAVDSGFVKLV